MQGFTGGLEFSERLKSPKQEAVALFAPRWAISGCNCCIHYGKLCRDSGGQGGWKDMTRALVAISTEIKRR